MDRAPIRFYSEQELDEIERSAPDRAYQIARAQALAERSPRPCDMSVLPDLARVEEAIADVRLILNRDGGDIELVGVDGHTVKVRMKGACVGCPNSVIDLRQVVEKVLVGVPGVAGVTNLF